MIYVLSDIHGHSRRWKSILKQIDLQPEDTLYVLGDVIDRHPDGIRILRQIMSMPNVEMLIGNHELMMLEALYYPIPKDCWEDEERHQRFRIWYNNGGRVTHEYLKRIRKSIRAEIFDYLDKLPHNIEIEVDGKQFTLTHAAPADEYPIYADQYSSEREFSAWKRHRYLSPKRNSTVIFGHTSTAHYQVGNPLSIFHTEKWIGIDCGCAYLEMGSPRHGRLGRLACIRLDDMKEFYSEEQPPINTKDVSE